MNGNGIITKVTHPTTRAASILKYVKSFAQKSEATRFGFKKFLESTRTERQKKKVSYSPNPRQPKFFPMCNQATTLKGLVHLWQTKTRKKRERLRGMLGRQKKKKGLSCLLRHSCVIAAVPPPPRYSILLRDRKCNIRRATLNCTREKIQSCNIREREERAS